MVETLEFSYVVGGQQRGLSVVLVGSLVVLKPIVEAMGLTWEKQREQLAKSADMALHRVTYPGAKLATSALEFSHLAAWLKGIKAGRAKSPELVRHFQDHLVPTIAAKSINLKAEAAKSQRELEQKKAAVITVDRPLDGVDRFRRDASRSPAHRLAPTEISAIARIGVLDLFIKQEAGLFEDQPSNRFSKQVMIVTPDGYRDGLLQDLIRANPNTYTGPEMLKLYPDHPLIQRRILPPTKIVSSQGGVPQPVIVPSRPERFSWEYS